MKEQVLKAMREAGKAFAELKKEGAIVFEDKAAARETLYRVREFVRENPTVYLSTHCPEGYENLEMKRVMTL